MAQKKIYQGIVIGCGNIGALLEEEPKRPKPATHAGAFTRNAKTELAALVDIDTAVLAAAGKLFPRAKRYSDILKCVDEIHPDIVAIATPPKSHRSLIELCAKRGVRAFICEKPLADNASEARAIAHLVKKYNLTLVLNYQRRFFPLIERIRRDISAGVLGAIEQVTGYYSNGLYNNGGHIIDTVLFLLENDRIISAYGERNMKNRMHPADDENIDALLRTKRGVGISLQSFDQGAYGIHEIRLYGTKGAIVVRDYGYEMSRLKVRPSLFREVRQLTQSTKKVRREESMVAGALAETLRALETKSAPASGIDNGIQTLKVLDTITKSARGKGVIIAV
jgi:predicted dehydrogenase